MHKQNGASLGLSSNAQLTDRSDMKISSHDVGCAEAALSPVSASMDELAHAISCAHDEVSELLHMLQPVMDMSTAAAGETREIKQGTCPLDKQIISQIDLVRGLISRMRAARNALRI